MVCQEAQVYHWQTRKNVFFNVMAEVETRTVKIWFAWSSEEDQAPDGFEKTKFGSQPAT